MACGLAGRYNLFASHGGCFSEKLHGQYPYSFSFDLTGTNTRFVESADIVDKIKAIKSAEEQDLIRRAAAMQDGAMRAAFAAVEPGMRDRDVAAIAQRFSQRHGSENGISGGRHGGVAGRGF